MGGGGDGYVRKREQKIRRENLEKYHFSHPQVYLKSES